MRKLMVVIGVVTFLGGVSAAAALADTSRPVNTSAPTIVGQPYVGKTQTASPGTWQNSPTSYGYQWARCDQNGNGCNQVGGATQKTYVPTSADVNHTLEVWVTAGNSAGTTGPVNSKPTAVITPALPPKNTVAPSVVGKPLVGEKLFADPGKYSGGSVQTFTYKWQSCDPNTLLCTDINGATSQTYTVVKTDVGKRLRVEVTASNPFGSDTEMSPATVAVTVPVVVVKTSTTASQQTTVCCQRVLLSGTTSPVKAGEQITILALETGKATTYPVGTATTDTNGNWSVRVTPMVDTTYTAQTSTSTGQPVAVLVHPRVGFGVNGNTFSAKITGRDSFAGRIALFQQLMPTGSWHRIAFVVINQLSVATFTVHLRHGHTYRLRIYLPQSQAGVGYLDGTSHTRQVGGAF